MKRLGNVTATWSSSWDGSMTYSYFDRWIFRPFEYSAVSPFVSARSELHSAKLDVLGSAVCPDATGRQTAAQRRGGGCPSQTP
jgi:hypothetical protein